MKPIDQQIVRLALPAIVTNITVPLLGLADTAIAGHLGSAAAIGAIAVGSMMFNLIYWTFGFLRMSTTGLTAQAHGRASADEETALLRRSLLASALVAALLVVGQRPLLWLMLHLIGPTTDLLPMVQAYYGIVVWGAPAVLALYALTGWFIGMQDTRTPMVVSITQNLANIAASLFLVFGLGLGVEGVALGTVMAQYVGLAMALVLLSRRYRDTLRHREPVVLPPFFSLNGHIFLRTLLLVAVNLTFTAVGARQGATLLAANALLMQLHLLFSYVIDGFAYAGEALAGRSWGALDGEGYRRVVRRLFGWGAAVTALFTVAYLLGAMPFLRLLTDQTAVLATARHYVVWACLLPAASMAAFVWDGIFIGTTTTRGMLVASAVATVAFFCSIWGLLPIFGNHALWFSLLLSLVARGAVETIIRPRLKA